MEHQFGNPFPFTKRLRSYLTDEQNQLLVSLPPLEATIDSVIEGYIALARIFLPRARRTGRTDRSRVARRPTFERRSDSSSEASAFPSEPSNESRLLIPLPHVGSRVPALAPYAGSVRHSHLRLVIANAIWQ